MSNRTGLAAVAVLAMVALGYRRVRCAEPAEPLVEGRMLLSGAVALVDEHLAGTVGTLDLLSRTREVQSGDWATMRPLLARMEQTSPPGDLLYLRRDGSYFTVKRGRVTVNASERPYFRKAVSGQVSVGDLILGRTTGRKDTIVAVPIRSGSKVQGVLAATLYLDDYSARITRALRIPANMVFFAISPTGETVLHSKTERIFQYPARQGSPSLRRAVGEVLAHREGMTSYQFEGRERKAVYQASPLTGWRFVLARIQ